ncbi:hypothetical protein BELL_0600g00030 [Botrytis elliptica]|uniref:Uncharacterized protein n=1 Tax=Botrytis elliptica TaxID=278938 RepID=A0A4Z1JIB1_9HELO|nr:hypothetical protein EAE99_001622 [Botrytis elliptica]TGO71260.1 hypothetical protein BELL_0600g00030 [Botrytis elliptica]
MASRSSSHSSKAKPLPQDGSSHGWRPLEDLTVSKRSGLERNGAHRRNKGNPKTLPRGTQNSDGEGSQSGSSTDSSTKFRSRGRRSNHDHFTAGTTRSKKKIDPYSDSDSDSGYNTDRGPRAASRTSTRSKKAQSITMIPGKYGPNDAYSDPVQELSHVKFAKEAIPSDHRRRTRSRSRQEKHDSNRVADTDKINGTIAEISRREYFKEDLEHRVADARPKSAKIEQPASSYSEGEAAQLCYDSEVELVDSGSHQSRSRPNANPNNREQLRDTKVPSGRAKSREHANRQPRHGNENSKEPRREYSFEPIRQPDVVSAWETPGQNRTRNPSPEANTQKRTVNEAPLDYRRYYKDFMRDSNPPAGTPRRPVVEQKSKSRYPADGNINPRLASDKGREHHKKPEQYTPNPDIFAQYDAPPEKEKKRKKSPSKIFKRFFGS